MSFRQGPPPRGDGRVEIEAAGRSGTGDAQLFDPAVEIVGDGGLDRGAGLESGVLRRDAECIFVGCVEGRKVRALGSVLGNVPVEGEQQQLAIARALAARPKVLLLDEPTEGIQPSIIREMGRTLKKIRDEKGLAILVSEQVLSFALDIADRILVIENGAIVHENRRDEVDEATVASYLSV